MNNNDCARSNEGNPWLDHKDRGWNVEKAEEMISAVRRYIFFFNGDDKRKDAGNSILKVLYKDKALREAVKNAAIEMHEILTNKENESGYHINHITSGKTSYCVFGSDGDKAYKTDGTEFDSEEAALKVTLEYDDAYAEPYKREDGSEYWIVWYEDPECTEDLKDNGCGHFIAEFAAPDEAEAEAAFHENGYVVELPSEEWYAVINNKTGKRVCNLLFPTETRALAFLYKAAKPKAWNAYLEEKEKTR